MKNLLFLLLALATLSSCGHTGCWTAQLSNGSRVKIDGDVAYPEYKIGDTVAVYQNNYVWYIDRDGNPLADTTIGFYTYHKAIIID